MRLNAVLAWVVAAFCSTGVASAQTDTLPDGRLSAVVITAQFTPTDARQTVNAVRVLDRKTIERRGAVNLEELLQTEPNLRLSQDPVLGSAISINGMRGENVKILVDGVPVVGRLNGSVDAAQLPLSAVQQVEIIEGAQSLLYGSEASAGVINLITRKSQPYRVEAEVTPQWESSGFRNTQGRAGVRMGKFLLQFTGQEVDFQPQPDSVGGRSQLWNPKKQTNGRAVLRYSAGERLDLRLSGGLFSEKVDNLGEIRRPRFKPYAFDDYYFTDRADLALHGEGWLPGRWFWQATAGWNRFDRIKNSYRFDLEEQRRTLLEGQQDTSAAIGRLGRLTVARDRADRRWNFLFGIEHFTERAEGVRIVDSAAATVGRADSRDLGLFASAKATFFEGRLILQGGSRWTFNSLYGSAATPSAWLLWRPQSRWQLRLSYANGFRSPGLKELYFNFIDINHFIVGNTALRPERSDNLRAELRRQSQEHRHMVWRMSLSGFYNRVRDRIVLVEFAPVQYRYINLRHWETVGGGCGVGLSIGEWLRFQSDVVLTGFFNTLSEEYATETALPRFLWAPDWVNDLTLLLPNQRFYFTLWHKMTGPTPYFFEENRQLVQGRAQGWHLLNLAAGGHFFEQRVRLSAGVKNLLGTRQIRARSTTEIGHGSGELRPVHWGRTFFVSGTFFLHSNR